MTRFSKSMKIPKDRCRGFSLLELMAVIVIIGIFSALAIPGIMQIQYRNTLADSVDRVRSAGAAARDLAMQTRQAAVLEVSGTGIWVNLLADAACTSGIDTRCVPSLGGFIPLYDAAGVGSPAGVGLCGGAVLTPGSGGACGKGPELTPSSGFALCYSGSGELFYRAAADTGTVCGASSGPSAAATAWVEACSVQTAVTGTFVDSSPYTLSDGAILMLNRYDGTVCGDAEDALDINRLIVFPTNGSPLSRIDK